MSGENLLEVLVCSGFSGGESLLVLLGIWKSCCGLVPEGGAGCLGVGLLLVLGITRLSSRFLRPWWSLLVVRLIIRWNSLRHDGCTFLFFV